MLRKLQWQVPGEPLTARYNWCQGSVLGRGPAVEKHCFKALAQHLPGSNGENQVSKENIRQIFKHVCLKWNSSVRPCNGLWTTGQLGTREQTLQRLKKEKKIITIMNTMMMDMIKMKKNMTVMMMSMTIMIMIRAEKNQGNRAEWPRTRHVTWNLRTRNKGKNNSIWTFNST